jgi:hypothetical protein
VFCWCNADFQAAVTAGEQVIDGPNVRRLLSLTTNGGRYASDALLAGCTAATSLQQTECVWEAVGPVPSHHHPTQEAS